MGRRAPGEGSVFYDKTRGCWVGQVDLGYDPATGKRRRRKVSAAAKTECREKLDELRTEQRRTGTVAPRNTTVAQVIRELFATPPASWRTPSTVDTYGNYARHMIATLGKVKLVKLTVADVERYLLSLARSGYSSSVISARKRLLATAIRQAQRDERVGRNVAEIARAPAGTRRQSKALTLGQVGALLGLDLTPWWRAYLITGILLGLRPGELLGLRWEDVDFAAGVLRVRKSLGEHRDPATGRTVRVLEDLKTERSKRTLQMPRSVVAVLKALKAAQAASKLRLGSAYADQGLVFCASHGQPCWRSAVHRAFRSRLGSAGIGGEWHPHEMRHTFVSVLSDAGVDIEDIADAAGHINSNVTRTVYRHFIADKVTRAPLAMDDIFGQVGGS